MAFESGMVTMVHGWDNYFHVFYCERERVWLISGLGCR